MFKLSKITSLLFLCNILRKKVRGEVAFLHADKDESYLQIDTMIFDGDGQAFLNFPKQQVCNISKKKLQMKLGFFAC